MTFKIEKIGNVDGDVAVVAVEGHIGIEEAAKVSKLFEDLDREGVAWSIVSLKGVEFISTAGVGALLYAVGGARKRGGDLVFVEFSPKTKAVFEFLDLHDFIVTATDVEAGRRTIRDMKKGVRPTKAFNP